MKQNLKLSVRHLLYRIVCKSVIVIRQLTNEFLPAFHTKWTKQFSYLYDAYRLRSGNSSWFTRFVISRNNWHCRWWNFIVDHLNWFPMLSDHQYWNNGSFVPTNKAFTIGIGRWVKNRKVSANLVKYIQRIRSWKTCHKNTHKLTERNTKRFVK